MAARSASTICWMRGRWTLTTTGGHGWPSGVVVQTRALWTWPMDAEATGTGSRLDEPPFQGLAVLLFDHALDVLKALRAHLVLQVGELRGDLPRHHVKARGKELAHLDEDAAVARGKRAEGDGDCPQPPGPRARGKPAKANAGKEHLPPHDAEHDGGEEPQGPGDSGI